MPKVITVIIILKTKARASCHRAVYRPSPAGRSARLLPTPVSDVFAGCTGKRRWNRDKQNNIKKEEKGAGERKGQ